MTILKIDEGMATPLSLQERPPFFLMAALSLLIHALFLGILFMASENPFLRETDTRQPSVIPIHLSPPVSHQAGRKDSLHQAPIRRIITETQGVSGKKQNRPIHAVKSQVQTPAPMGKTLMRDIAGTGGNEELSPPPEKQTKSVALTMEGLPSAASGSSGLDSPTMTALSLEKPRYALTPSPIYPRAARNRGQEGVVLLSVEVLADGRTGQILIKKSSGYALLDRSALEAIRSWRFEPAKRKHIPLAMTVDIPIRFSLQDDN